MKKNKLRRNILIEDDIWSEIKAKCNNEISNASWIRLAIFEKLNRKKESDNTYRCN